jgi:hypothetical protein
LPDGQRCACGAVNACLNGLPETSIEQLVDSFDPAKEEINLVAPKNPKFLHVLSEWTTVEAVSSVEMTRVDNGNSYTKMHFLELFPEKLKNPAETRKCVWM